MNPACPSGHYESCVGVYADPLPGRCLQIRRAQEVGECCSQQRPNSVSFLQDDASKEYVELAFADILAGQAMPQASPSSCDTPHHRTSPYKALQAPKTEKHFFTWI